MIRDFVVNKNKDIAAPVARVWDMLTTPEGMEQYLFGTKVETDWQVGSLIIFRGEWEGKPYEDRGTIEVFEPEKIFEYTYYSSASAVADQAENYSVVRMELEPIEVGTRLTIKHRHFPNETEYQNHERHWGVVLNTIKDTLEGRPVEGK